MLNIKNMNIVMLQASEACEIVKCLSNGIASMESEASKKEALELAKKLVAICKEFDVKVFAYDETQYMGKTYHIKPDDDYLFGIYHKWTTEDPHYEEVSYTEYDRLRLKDDVSLNEERLELVRSLTFKMNARDVVFTATRNLKGHQYSWKLVLGNGFLITGPYDECGELVETGFVTPIAVEDLFKKVVKALDCLPLVEYEISHAVMNVVEEEKSRLVNIVEEERRQKMIDELHERFNEIKCKNITK